MTGENERLTSTGWPRPVGVSWTAMDTYASPSQRHPAWCRDTHALGAHRIWVALIRLGRRGGCQRGHSQGEREKLNNAAPPETHEERQRRARPGKFLKSSAGFSQLWTYNSNGGRTQGGAKGIRRLCGAPLRFARRRGARGPLNIQELEHPPVTATRLTAFAPYHPSGNARLTAGPAGGRALKPHDLGFRLHPVLDVFQRVERRIRKLPSHRPGRTP